MMLRRFVCAVSMLCSVVGSAQAAHGPGAVSKASFEEVAPGVLVAESQNGFESMVIVEKPQSQSALFSSGSSGMLTTISQGVQINAQGEETQVVVVSTILQRKGSGDLTTSIDVVNIDKTSDPACEARCSREFNATSNALQQQMDEAAARYYRDKAACNGNQACIDAVTATFVSVADAIIANQYAANERFRTCLAGCRGGAATQ